MEPKLASNLRAACIIPTYNGYSDLKRLLNSLSNQTADFDVMVVDSSSTDGTHELSAERLAKGEIKKLVRIPTSDFNHGGTRQKMVDDFPDYDIYIFLTQDAILEDSYSIENILHPFEDPLVAAVCGRQLPHHDANLISQHARHFNYPATTKVKTQKDIPTLGIKAPFMSNSFSAYRGKTLRSVGGFPSHVILSEDMYVGAKILLSNHKIVYAGQATCRHSHNYSLSEEFRRYFDIGVFHAREKWIRNSFGSAGGEGIAFIKSELSFLGIKHIHLWPGALLRNGLKLIAYKLGQKEHKLPLKFKRVVGMHRGYWSSPLSEKV